MPACLQRVYAITFPDDKELKEYQHRMEEAKKRDHRNVGTQQARHREEGERFEACACSRAWGRKLSTPASIGGCTSESINSKQCTMVVGAPADGRCRYC